MEFIFMALLLWFALWLTYRVWTRMFQTRGYRDRQRRKYARDIRYPWEL